MYGLKPVPFKLKPVPFKGRDTQDYFNKLLEKATYHRAFGVQQLENSKSKSASQLWR